MLNESSDYYETRVYEMWDKANQKWNEFEYVRLLYYITGDSDPTLNDVTAIAKTNNNRYTSSGYTGVDSSVINSKSTDFKKSYENIMIFLGDMYWTPVYLSQDKNGDTILTLWFADVVQPSWGSFELDYYEYEDEEYEDEDDDGYYIVTISPVYDDGANYGYYGGNDSGYLGVYSSYSCWCSNKTEVYPCNMYGTSYVNAVTLNNGGVYTTDSNTLVTATKKADNPFAILTIPENGLTQYLVTPRNMSWQENQDSRVLLGEDYCYSNESYSSSEDSDFSNSSYNYSSIDYYDSWADSYVWLPSLSELGNNFPTSNGHSNYGNGLWNIDGDQFDYSDDLWLENGEEQYSGFLLRSAFESKSNFTMHQTGGAYSAVQNNVGDIVTKNVNINTVIRPAIHLNLSAIDESLNRNSVNVGELFDSESQTFNKDNYDILLKYLTGNANATLNTVSTVASANNNQYSSRGFVGTDASYFRNVTLTAGTSGSTIYAAKGVGDVKVTLGGLQWDCVYLSEDNNGDTVLTLWLDSNLQDAWTGCSGSSNGAYFVRGGMFFDGDASTNYLSSDVRNDVLTNQSQSSKFCLFTMSQHGLTNYMVTPSNMSWQQYNYTKSMPTGNISASFEEDLTNCDDYLWLPSLREVGCNENELEGLWNLSAKQKSNEKWFDSIVRPNTDVYYFTETLLRTIIYTTKSNIVAGMWRMDLSYTGDDSLSTQIYRNSTYVDSRDNGAIRPALHLNLSAIYEELYSEDLSDGKGAVTVNPASGEYDGNAKTPTITVKYNGVTLAKDVDYTLSYTLNGVTVSEFKAAGTYTITATGKKLYKGSVSTTYTIATLPSLSDGKGSITVSPSSEDYNGSARAPTITVKYNGTTLALGTDYTLTFTLNGTQVDELKLAGTYTITATGIGDYRGTISTTYTINSASVAGIKLADSSKLVMFKRSDAAPHICLVDGAKQLMIGIDYTITHSVNFDALTGTATVTYMGGYTGTKTLTYTLALLDPIDNVYVAVFS